LLANQGQVQGKSTEQASKRFFGNIKAIFNEAKSGK